MASLTQKCIQMVRRPVPTGPDGDGCLRYHPKRPASPGIPERDGYFTFHRADRAADPRPESRLQGTPPTGTVGVSGETPETDFVMIWASELRAMAASVVAHQPNEIGFELFGTYTSRGVVKIEYVTGQSEKGVSVSYTHLTLPTN